MALNRPGEPLVCPPHTFGRYPGLYSHPDHPQIFYSVQRRPVTAQRRNELRQVDHPRRISWNPATVEVALARLALGDAPGEWAWLVHRLREESSHATEPTLLPELLHSVALLEKYVKRKTRTDRPGPGQHTRRLTIPVSLG